MGNQLFAGPVFPVEGEQLTRKILNDLDSMLETILRIIVERLIQGKPLVGEQILKKQDSQCRETYQRRRLKCIQYQRRQRESMTLEQRERVRILARPSKVAYQNKRRALKAGVPSEKVHLKDILKRDGPTCYLCGKTLNPSVKGEISLDHVIPLTKGGPHTAENIRIACLPCNIRKGNRSLEEFRELQHLTSHTGQLE